MALAADPCQQNQFSKTGSICSSMKANHGVSDSVIKWLLERLIAEDVAGRDMLAAVDLLNRYHNSRRCREASAELVSFLSPLCMPSAPEVWNHIVDGKRLWPALGHREARTRIDRYLDREFPEILLF